MKRSDFLDNVARFWSYVDTSGTCWLWTGEVSNMGYGQFCLWHDGHRSRVLAHRLVLSLVGRALRDGEVVRHACDNPPCVRPDHLTAGTQAENVKDALDRDRLDTSGLAVGQASTWPPRPCRRCGTTVTEGRRRYCDSCRVQVTRENHARYNAKRASA